MKMKKAYTLIEFTIVLSIILILIFPVFNVAKAYNEALLRVKAKGTMNDLSSLISYSKYYCRYYNVNGLIEVDKEYGKVVFKNLSSKGTIVKTIFIEDGVRLVADSSLSITKTGKVQSDTIRLIDSEGKLYKLTISTGIDTVNIYEGD